MEATKLCQQNFRRDKAFEGLELTSAVIKIRLVFSKAASFCVCDIKFQGIIGVFAL